jgi:Mn-dependent DtxR family transcriptional regulator
MIWRLSGIRALRRINELSEALNVHPPSATRMVQKLGMMNLLQYERYGRDLLRAEGKRLGELLLERHNVIENFFRMLGSVKTGFGRNEKVEHMLSDETIKSFQKYISFANDNPDVLERLKNIRDETDGFQIRSIIKGCAIQVAAQPLAIMIPFFHRRKRKMTYLFLFFFFESLPVEFLESLS